MTERLQRTTSADLPRLAGFDQDDLRDLRTPRPAVEALPRPSDQGTARLSPSRQRGRRAAHRGRPADAVLYGTSGPR